METPAKRQRAALLSRVITYVPFHAVLEACRGESLGPGQQTRKGAVLVADLSGFTSLSETYARRGRDGTDELTQLLNVIFTSLLHDAVFPYGGYLVKFAGDALLAFFDGPDHAEDACAAALAAQRAMASFASARTDAGGLAIRIGVGAGRLELFTVGKRGQRLEALCAGPAALQALAAVDQAKAGEIVLVGEGLPEGRYTATSELLGKLHGTPPATRPLWVNLVKSLSPAQVEHALSEVKAFFAHEVFDAIVNSPSAVALPAERRHACAVFAELGGWDQDLAQLSESFTVACEAAARHGGSVNKLDATAHGPRLLATFGVPFAHGDDERRAVAFSLELRDRLYRARPRVGIESGPLFAGEVGSSLKREFTVMGDTVNVAARLAGVAVQGQILCGPDCWSRISTFTGRPTASLKLKGKSEPVTPMEVLASRRLTGNRLALRVGHPPLIGRDDELEIVEEAARRVRGGAGASSLTLLGPPGSGKSALAGVIVDRWLTLGGTAFSARCEYDRRDVPLTPLRAMTTAWLETGFDEMPTEATLSAALKRIGLDDGLIPGIMAELAPKRAARIPNQGSTRILTLKLVLAITRATPLLLVVEDVHNADQASVDIFDYLVRSAGDAPLFFLFTARPEAHVLERLKGGGHGMLDVRPLEPDASRALLSRALSTAGVTDRLAEAVEARSRGNPFVLLRLAGWLAGRGLLTRIGERTDLPFDDRGDAGITLPPDLESLVHADVDQLPGEAREVLRTVCVLGAQFAPRLAVELCETSGVGNGRTLDALEALSRHGLLTSTGGASPVYRFARLIDREVIYAGLPAGQRRALHARVAQILLAGGERQERVALHYDAADDHPNAAKSCLEAAARAYKRGAAADALRLYRAARRHIAAMGGDETECEVAEIECLCVLASYGEARRVAVALAAKLPPGPARIRALISAAKCATHEGDHPAALALNRRARDEIPADSAPALKVNFLVMCAMNHYSVGKPLEALVDIGAARPLADGTDMAAVVQGIEAGLLVETGRTSAAVEAAQAAMQLATTQRHRGNLALTLVYLGRALDVSGDRRNARARYREATRLYQDLDQPVNAANAALHAAEIDLELGDPRLAIEQLLPVLETSRHFAAGQLETAALCSLGRARFQLGDLVGAVRALELAVRLCETTLEHHAAICGRAWLAEALWVQEPARAKALLEQALRTGRDRGMVVELAAARETSRRLGFDEGRTRSDP